MNGPFLAKNLKVRKMTKDNLGILVLVGCTGTPRLTDCRLFVVPSEAASLPGPTRAGSGGP